VLSWAVREEEWLSTFSLCDQKPFLLKCKTQSNMAPLSKLSVFLVLLSLAFCLSSTGAAPAYLRVPLLSQHNSAWASVATTYQGLAVNGHKLTIGSGGSEETSYAMLARYYGLKSGFSPVAWSSPDKATKLFGQVDLERTPTFHRNDLMTQFGDFGANWIEKSDKAEATKALKEIKQKIAARIPVVILLGNNHADGYNYETAVVAVGITGKGDIAINDPNTGKRGLLSSLAKKASFTGYHSANFFKKYEKK
jgi:hypothetical protein